LATVALTLSATPWRQGVVAKRRNDTYRRERDCGKAENRATHRFQEELASARRRRDRLLA
jgi:hypothetical protein